ncbi:MULTISPECIES: hypothetical protein [Mycolicibacter]|uniref:Mce associated membrane protein n=3 Tax=Mycolicibacter TaxID=1073531 RepID=A0A9X7WGY8_9MYCO|nr:Mce associated membrane protein [Mycolicibacter heraklionensis]MCV7382964.1 Mce protein [Mycolicibacter longobardus]ODU04405.1 MAG: Mce protein [Pseudonocardia sp. SCN 72-51]PQM54033.1 Mce protein [Mycolicibacter virginiensis]ORW06485.1 Mce protein [Mycolicibacter longobardus]
MSTADEPTAETAPEDVEETAAPPVRRRRVPWRMALVAAAYLAVFGLVIGLGWQLWQQHRVSSAEAAGRQAAVDYAQVLTSIDSDKVDDDFDAVLNGATGEFKDTYTKASVNLRQLLIDNKARAQGTVVESAVQSGSKDTVVVLVMVNQTITNTMRPDPRVDRARMKMTMQKVDGRWLASKVELP